MKILRNPIFWVLVIVIVVVFVGFKVMKATFMQQQALKQKAQEREMVLKDYNLYGLAVVPPSTLWVAGSGGIVLHSSNTGDTWEERQVGAPEQVFTSVAFPDKDHGWLAGNRGTILHTEDGGKTWNRVDRKGDTTFYMSMFFLDAQHGWIVGEMGALLLTTDGGKSWESINTDKFFNTFTDVLFLNKERGWIVSERGLIMTSADGGRTWQDQQSNTTTSLMSVAVAQDGDKVTLWVGGLEGIILTSQDLGVTWETKILRNGEQKITNHVYKVYDKLSGTKGLGHHQVYTLCRNTQQYTFDGGVGWRAFMLDQETSSLLDRSWLHDMEFYRSSADALSQEAGWAAAVADQGESSLGWAVGQSGIVIRTTDSQNWRRIH
jgi:photosystem II stability/assembly factor-like uncharacterized protein